MQRTHSIKRTLWMAPSLLVTGILLKGLLSVAFAKQPTKDQPSIKECEEAVIAGIGQGLGFPPLEQGQGIGHFTLEGLKDVYLTMPRKYINFKPNRPDGETDALNLTFYFPEMKSYQEMAKTMTSREMYPYEISVFISGTAHYIKCWEGGCLGTEFALFQVDIRHFQVAPKIDPSWDACFKEECAKRTYRFDRCPNPSPPPPRCLKDGHYDKALNLVAYLGREKARLNHRQEVFHTVYLKPGADPCYPKEWIYCEGYACNQHWFRNGMRVKSLFSRHLLPRHAEIRTQLDHKIDEFIAISKTKLTDSPLGG